MTAYSKNSFLWSLLLVVLGIVALYTGTRWLVLLIPAASLVWYEARTMIRTGRN